MRDSGFASTGPNFAKSTLGHGRSSMPPTPAPAARGAAPPAAGAPLANASTSSFMMRPLSPLPFTVPRFTPSSRASLRTAGPGIGERERRPRRPRRRRLARGGRGVR